MRKSSGKLTNALSTVASLSKTTLAVGGLVALTACGDPSANSENRYASNNDIEGKLKSSQNDYIEDMQKKGVKINLNIDNERIAEFDSLAKQILFVMGQINGIENKVVLIDTPGAASIRINEILKRSGVQTTLNMMVSWSDKQGVIDTNDYSELFATISKTNISKADNHVIQEVEQGNKTKYITHPWAISFDYNRTPSYESNDALNQVANMVENGKTFFNGYTLGLNDFPAKEIYKKGEKDAPIRDGIIVFTPTEMNYDTARYLDAISQSGMSNIEVYNINSELDIEGINKEEYIEFSKMANERINESAQVINQPQQEGQHHTHSTFVYPWRLYHSGYYNGYSSGTYSNSFSSNSRVTPSKSTNLKSGLSFRANGGMRGANVYNAIKTSTSPLAKSFSARGAITGGARGGLG